MVFIFGRDLRRGYIGNRDCGIRNDRANNPIKMVMIRFGCLYRKMVEEIGDIKEMIPAIWGIPKMIFLWSEPLQLCAVQGISL